MRICLGRYLFPETNYTQCRESNINDEMIEFIIAHPCRWNVIETCLPIYFTVISKDDMNVNNVNNNNNQQPNKCYYLHSDGKFVEGK